METPNCKSKFRALLTQAPYVPGHAEKFTGVENIPWADPILIQDGLNFYQKHHATFVLSSCLTIFLGVIIKPISAVFFRVGSLHDPEASFQRILRTFAGVHEFYKTLLEPEQAKKQFEKIRKMHAIGSTRKMEINHDPRPIPEILKEYCQESWKRELVEAIKKDCTNIQPSFPVTPEEQKLLDQILVWDPPVPISQFEMMATVLTSFGCMWLHPSACGIKNREKELAGIIHLWAVFARLLGIEDRFNILLDTDLSLIDKLMQNLAMSSLKSMDEVVVTFQNALVEGARKRCPGVTYKGLLFHALSVLVGDQFSGENLWNVMNWQDKFCAKGMQFAMWLSITVPGLRIVINLLLKGGVRVLLAFNLPGSRLKKTGSGHK